MNIITLFPFEGILLFDKYIPFNATWQVVQILLGIPEHRYLDFDINDMDDIVGDDGNYIYDYRIEAPAKTDFFEEREGIKFVYRNNNLCSVEPDSSYHVRFGDIVFHNKGSEEYNKCKELYSVEEYNKGRKFAVMELGVIGFCNDGFGFYKIFAKNEFNKIIKCSNLLEEIINKELRN